MGRFSKALEQLHFQQITFEEFFGSTASLWQREARRLDGAYPTGAADEEDILLPLRRYIPAALG